MRPSTVVLTPLTLLPASFCSVLCHVDKNVSYMLCVAVAMPWYNLPLEKKPFNMPNASLFIGLLEVLTVLGSLLKTWSEPWGPPCGKARGPSGRADSLLHSHVPLHSSSPCSVPQRMNRPPSTCQMDGI